MRYMPPIIDEARLLIALTERGRLQMQHIYRVLMKNRNICQQVVVRAKAKGLLDVDKQMGAYAWYSLSKAGQAMVEGWRVDEVHLHQFVQLDTVSIPSKLRFLDQLRETVFKDHAALAGIIADYRAALLVQSKEESERL